MPIRDSLVRIAPSIGITVGMRTSKKGNALGIGAPWMVGWRTAKGGMTGPMHGVCSFHRSKKL